MKLNLLCFYHSQIFFNDVYEVNLPLGHRFPMIKYRLIREALQKEYVSNKFISFHVSPTATKEELITTHCSEYIDRYISGKLTEKEIRKTWQEGLEQFKEVRKKYLIYE